MPRKLALALGIFVFSVLFLGKDLAPVAYADEGWVIKTFDASYQVNRDGTFDVVEDITVDFRGLQKHGIYRDIPYKYAFDDTHNRVTEIKVASVDDGSKAWKYEVSRDGSNLRIKIGDPDKLISGVQRYRITYRVIGGLNPQETADELYWNATGNAWPVSIEAAAASVRGPDTVDAACFQGVTGSSSPCSFTRLADGSYRFVSQRSLSEGQGLTFVVSFETGSINVPPLKLERIKSPEEKVRDFIGLSPLPIAGALALGIVSFASIGRYWWTTGRDRWRGDVQYLTQAPATAETVKPFFARETIVVEYQPPEVGKRTSRRMRPAEVGVLMDERADTLDVSATIVDLAVRGYLRISEVEKKWLFGSRDYTLDRLREDTDELIPYERRLLTGLFETGSSVQMSDLKNKFYSDLSEVKSMLYTDISSELKLFAGSPEKARTVHAVVGAIVTAIGVFGIFILGGLGAAIIAVPIVLLGLLVLVFSGTMARRTSSGRELYRRSLGFREYMVIAETDRQKFNEEINRFAEYLPYAIVFGCTGKWARAFEGLDGQPPDISSWYVGTRAFVAADFARDITGFSGTLSSVMASTPGGSGGSGFSGGSSGGGGGGGGGGSW